MIKYIVMYEDPFVKQDNKKRNRALLKTSFLSMALNAVLACGKIVGGAIAGAISLVSDGFNNLSDCVGNTITVIGVKAASSPADKEHPYGHARSEYVATVIFSCLIIFLALELLSLSLENIFSGTRPDFSALGIAILALGIVVKLAMFAFNRKMGKKYSSDLMLAASVDSLGDVLSSAVVLVSLIVSHFTSFNPDGYVGIFVSIVIAVSGAKILRRTTSELIGRRPDKNFIAEMEKRLLSYEGVYGVHGLTVHSYSNRLYASVHVEIDADIPVLTAHELIDKIEKDFADNTQIDLTIHLDPVILHNHETSRLFSEVEELIKKIDTSFALHDFRIIMCECPKLTFEVCVPFETKLSDDEVCSRIYEELYDKFGLKYTYSVDIKRELVASDSL